MSVDGYIDDAGPDRLVLSSEADLDRVDEVRASCDAILVGAGTVRGDDPRLVIRSPERRAARLGRGVPEDPVKVTITATGNLDPAARFFTAGRAARLVYCARPALAAARARLSGVAEVIDAGDSPSPVLVICDLAERGMARVLLEGGGQLAAEYLAADLVDELHLVVAPFFVGDPAAPRFAVPGGYPHSPANRMRLAEVRQLGDVVLLRYLLGTRPEPRPPEPRGPRPEDIAWLRETIERLGADDPLAAPPGSEPPHGPADLHWLRETIELSRRCPPSRTAFSVGAVIVGADGTPLATGFSREADPRDHAEEAALGKVPPGDRRLDGATLYSSLEPCGARASRPRPCAELIIAAGLRRVVYAWREPPLLATGGGAEILRAAGVSVTEVPELAAEAREVNAHLTGAAGR
jgi:5-amino-6-(5-phosphoribosylamino)uracil reductase